MEYCRAHVIMALLVCLVQTPVLIATHKSYIVYLGSHSHGTNPTSADAEIATQSHYNLLGSVLGSEKARDSIFYSYNKYINGFAAVLTKEEAEKIKNSPNVVSVFEDYGLSLHTTRSWEFMELEDNNGVATSQSLWKKSKYGRDAIIGNLDTGVWPESLSFNDEGLGPIPLRWKGACVDESPNKVKCNNKLIGARYFKKGYEMLTHKKLNSSYESARDHVGHGTHTLSTAGGSFVTGASILGYDYGTVKGGSPKARVAAYKVFWPPAENGLTTSSTTDFMAAIEAAIADGVDVLSMSIGSFPYFDYKYDALAIGAFHAVQHGITVVASAGNSGPNGSTVANSAPWFLTVGAGTLDREFTNWVSFGGKHYKGRNDVGGQLLPKKQSYPVVNSASAKLNLATIEAATLCEPNSIDPSKVKGKIVVCSRGGNHSSTEKSLVVLEAGGVGYILANEPDNKTDTLGRASMEFLPAAHLTRTDSQILFNFISNSMNPYAYITGTKTLVGSKRAPVVASFSSIGPNPLDPEILKPDIIAPGVSIIAAFSEAVGPTKLFNDTRRVKFNFISGTSMACPHVSGIVGLLKTLHPDWSPAAIRSAISTTAITTDNTKKPISKSSTGEMATPLDYGAGHVRPNKAANPGLVYDLTEADYLNFLCAKGYTENDLIKMARKPYKCPSSSDSGLSLVSINYPAVVVPKLKGWANITREVKNVENFGSTYKVTVTAPAGVSVHVEPVSLKFDKPGDVNKFSVILKAVGELSTKNYVFGELVWSDGVHKVRSPIAVMAAT